MLGASGRRSVSSPVWVCPTLTRGLRQLRVEGVAHETATAGASGGPWDHVPVAELNELARDLEDFPLARQVRNFIEVLTFADVEAIKAMIGEFVAEVGPLPVWARNLTYRLICLQCPDDSTLLREAGIDLHMHGPDWDEIAIGLQRRADELERGAQAG